MRRPFSVLPGDWVCCRCNEGFGPLGSERYCPTCYQIVLDEEHEEQRARNSQEAIEYNRRAAESKAAKELNAPAGPDKSGGD